MHVFLVSACRLRAWKRSRAVLDSYARRVGERAWATPITMEGLEEMKLLLRKQATRQTAVACYRNEGLQRMKLLWIVGSRSSFGPDGHFPAGFTRLPPKPKPTWLRDVCLLAQSAGLLHDWGKAGEPFAAKLKASIEGGQAQEAVRHEWASMCLLRKALSSSFDNAWEGASGETAIKTAGKPFRNGLGSAQLALEFVIATHHRLLGQTDFNQRGIDGTGHIREDISIPLGGVRSAGELDKQILVEAQKTIGRLLASPRAGAGAGYWRPVATMARAAMILADHHVSSISYADLMGGQQASQAEAPLFANTKTDAETGLRRYDQPLNWHLRMVSERAADIAYRMATHEFEALSDATVESILAPAEQARFRWQDNAVAFLRERRGDDARPALVLNMASTGAGKTRANAKLACVLSSRPRFNIALNLRSLTLQTGDSLKVEMGLQADELGVVIGDVVTRRLHQASQDAFSLIETDLGAEDSADGLIVDVDVACEDLELPHWLKPFDTKGKAARLLLPPVLVSTIDFIINAGEPGRQGHHALALLRTMGSDLVLDEIDSFDPTALAAVLRLIQVTAMMGRSVICSSATLSVPVAAAVHDAYLSGLKMHAALNDYTGQSQVYLVDDRLEPQALMGDPVKATAALKEMLGERHARLLESISQAPRYRVPMLQLIHDRSIEAVHKAVLEAAKLMHANQQWGSGDGRALSFGLVRVANIKQAIPLARFLAQTWPEARVACYHGNEMRLQRYLKECRLDFLLTRKRGGAHILADAEIREALQNCPSVPFVVVATPVEEIGRDHDFDWAVIEPSSAHSIVQACGRVNRHRLQPVDTPNIALLDLNFRYAGKPADLESRGCFVAPGLEGQGKKLKYSAQTLSDLIDWNRLDRVDVALRLGAHPIAADEDRLLEARLNEPVTVLAHPAEWLCSGLYQGFKLRDSMGKRRFRMEPHPTVPGAPFVLKMLRPERGEHAWVDRAMRQVERAENDWLAWDCDALQQEAQALGIDSGDALAFEIAVYKGHEISVYRDESFGFMRIDD